MCFSLILLSVDLSSPHVKNKMSKREFIRNTRGAVGAEGDNKSDLSFQQQCRKMQILLSQKSRWLICPNKNILSAVGRGLEEDLYGSLYDNIFLRGHIGRSQNCHRGRTKNLLKKLISKRNFMRITAIS